LIEARDYAEKLQKKQKLIDKIKNLDIDENDDEERSKKFTLMPETTIYK
jgi:hypothetical protein